MAEPIGADSLELLKSLRGSELFHPFRVLLEGGRVWTWDPAGGMGAGLPLMAPLTELSQFAVVATGDCVVTSLTRPQWDAFVGQNSGSPLSAALNRVHAVCWSSGSADEPAEIAGKWRKLVSQLPIDFHHLLGMHRPAVRKAIFLDRDGVVLEAVPYLKDPDQVRLREGVVEFLKRARSEGYRIFLVTNQSGLGRGLFTWREFDRVQNRMILALTAAGVWLDDIEVAPHFKDSTSPEFWLWPQDRKPGAGMIERLRQKHGIDLRQSLFVGDRESDLAAGQRAGVKHLYLLESAETESELTDPALSHQRISSFSQVILP